MTRPLRAIVGLEVRRMRRGLWANGVLVAAALVVSIAVTDRELGLLLLSIAWIVATPLVMLWLIGSAALDRRSGRLVVYRSIPIGERTLAWLGKYLTEARPKLTKPDDEAGPLFVTERGTPFTTKHLSALVTERLKGRKKGVRSWGLWLTGVACG